MIVSGGENVFPREVEDLLAEHGEIEDVAVVGVEDKEFGQRLKAFVVPRNGDELTAEAIQAYVKQNLARYKVPRDIVFVDRAAAQRHRQGAQAGAPHTHLAPPHRLASLEEHGCRDTRFRSGGPAAQPR